ncbi:MAG TPA: phosphatase PAP2 family protein [Chloroflexota bacterium]
MGPVQRWNQGISAWIQGPEEQPLTVIGFLTDWLFSGQVVVGLGIAACIVFALRRQRLAALSAALIFPLVLVEVALKVLVDQPPASSYLHIRLLFGSSLGVRALEHGFPSGHASRIGFVIGWLALVVVPRRYRWPAAAVLSLLTLFIVWTRLYVGDHSVLELLAGLLLAAAFLLPAQALARLAKATPPR